MAIAQSTSPESLPFPPCGLPNEDDGRFRRSLKPSIVSRLRETHSHLEGKSGAEPIHVHASIGCATIAAGASISLGILATHALTGAGRLVGESYLLRISAVLMQTGVMLVGVGLLVSLLSRIFRSGLAIDRNKGANNQSSRRV
jgi:hypothetical protein